MIFTVDGPPASVFAPPRSPVFSFVVCEVGGKGRRIAITGARRIRFGADHFATDGYDFKTWRYWSWSAAGLVEAEETEEGTAADLAAVRVTVTEGAKGCCPTGVVIRDVVPRPDLAAVPTIPRTGFLVLGKGRLVRAADLSEEDRQRRIDQQIARLNQRHALHQRFWIAVSEEEQKRLHPSPSPPPTEFSATRVLAYMLE